MYMLLVLAVVIVVVVVVSLCGSNRENFDFTGLVYNRPPEWFNKKPYNPSDWLVAYYPDQISNPECMTTSRGDPEMLNYMASAYRFWRM
jgi:hypothetical protein